MGVIKDKFKEKSDTMSAEIKEILKNMVIKRSGRFLYPRYTRECVALQGW